MERRPSWRRERIRGGQGFLFAPWQQFRPMEGQPREYFDPVKMAELQGSIEEVGQLTAVKVKRIDRDRQGRIYELIDGERRWRICRELKRNVKFVIDEVTDGDEHYLFSAISNFGNAEHPMMEKARALERVRQMPKFKDLTPVKEQVRRLARAFARSDGWVYQHLRLLSLHEDVQARLDPTLPKEQQISFSVAVSLCSVPHDEQVALLERITHGSLDMRQSRALINDHVRSGYHSGGGQQAGGRKRKPSDDLQILRNFLKRVNVQSAIILATDAENVQKMLGGRSATEKSEISAGVDKCILNLQKMKALLEKAIKPVEKP